MIRPWAADPLLPGHASLELPLADEPTFALEPQGSLVATLVRRGEPRRRRAVLYVHGWSDYFFQDHVSAAFCELGFDFYAIDLRRYGRSLREGQLAGYIPDMTDYRVELDAACDVIRDEGHDSVVLCGHSTGGLIAALHADDRPGAFDAVVLNSPWIELQGSAIVRFSMHPLMRTVSAVAPTTALPMSDNGFYLRTIRAEEEGEWHFDPNLKGDKAFYVRVGWLRAVMAGQARIARGLEIDAPVLVLTSAESVGGLVGGQWTDEYHHADGVLDVRRIAQRAHQLGPHVTLVRIEGALHDVALSAEPVRRRAFDEVSRFLGAYATA
ncbi:alpha/beta hydrolase [uncultured Tessaracoccus sp.]|uniref:alpha/beta hydrolase n=1 Tax=uncultured Tessaracoccus sp. TaxID=905023 RepID=UPI0025E29D90|nr:alpha/beta hydrolase [uncultured Tessaracoccus sp.]